MIPIRNIERSSPSIPATYSVHWKGHMANDVAATGASGTGAVLCANADEIWLSGNLGDLHLPRTGVLKITRDGMYPWFFQGLRIRHRVAGLPKNIQFIPKPGKTRDVIAELKTLGFPTS